MMQPKDDFCRAALYPKFAKDGVFSDEVFLQFSTIVQDVSYALSLASRFGLRDETGAHGYGLRAAKSANKRFVEKNGREPDPEDEEVHYVGFYDMHADVVEKAPLRFYTASLKYAPEHGETEHFQVEMHLTTSDSSIKKRRQDRVALRTVIADNLRGPRRYRPGQNENRPTFLASLELPVRPKQAS